jgi:hypothetical protein
MKQKMNDSAPLPLSMSNEQFKSGVRDVLYYNDEKIPGAVELKEVFDFMLSDRKETKLQYQNGDETNYLPTKNFKITVNKDDILKTNTVPADMMGRLADTMKFTYPGNYLAKDNLALMDILVHNNWKRPIYFTVTAPGSVMMGLEKYLYNEGFASRLLPLQPDTAASPAENVNPSAMYNNVMNKFKWGNMKEAKYLDHESLTMFYPLISRVYVDMIDGLIKQGKTGEAKLALNKYMTDMPNFIPVQEAAIRKFYLADSAYKLGETATGDKLLTLIDDYLVNSLNFTYGLYKDGKTGLDNNDIQLGLSLLNGMVGIAKNGNRPGLSTKYDAQVKDFSRKFGLGM